MGSSIPWRSEGPFIPFLDRTRLETEARALEEIAELGLAEPVVHDADAAHERLPSLASGVVGAIELAGEPGVDPVALVDALRGALRCARRRPTLGAGHRPPSTSRRLTGARHCLHHGVIRPSRPGGRRVELDARLAAGRAFAGDVGPWLRDRAATVARTSHARHPAPGGEHGDRAARGPTARLRDDGAREPDRAHRRRAGRADDAIARPLLRGLAGGREATARHGCASPHDAGRPADRSARCRARPTSSSPRDTACWA